MAEKFHLIIMASNRAYYDGQCEYVSVPTTEGIIGVMAHHQNSILAIVPGILNVLNEKGKEVEVRDVSAVSNGIIKIEDNNVIILVDTLETPDEIDVNRALRAEEEAKEALLQKKSQMDYYQAEASLARAVGRIKASKYKKI